ncbi:hypothetical protein ABBQ38_007043 [Trebouxia sp. C0009 RCD-2024]
MRQEHLAAIANLNTFAKKRANKSPKSTSGAASSSPAASRLSMPSATDDGQLWTPSNVAAAVHSAAPLGRSPTQPDTIWSNEPLLACGPTANSAEPPNGAGDWHQAGYSTSNPPTAVSMKLATLQNGSSAKSQAVATSHCGTDLPWMQATNLCSTRPGAHDRADGYAAHAAARPACQGRMSAASASLASRSSSTSGSSQQDNSTVLQTTSTSSCSSYTNAGSMVSIACSTPHHSEANSRLTHHRSGLPAPQMDVEAATPEGTDNHTGKEEQAPATSHEALVARQGQHHPQKGDDATAQACVQALPEQTRNPNPHACLASRESSPDEALIAEGWIVAGTIMSNRDYKPDAASAASTADSASGASVVLPQKAPSSHPVGAFPTLSTDEVGQLTQELEVLKEQPRAQMTSQQLGRYLDIKIKLGRAGSTSSTSAGRVQQPKLQVTPVAHAGVKAPSGPSLEPGSARADNSRAKPVRKAAVIPNKADAKTSGCPAKREGENKSSSGRHVPAYMKATASVKAKDARDQQAKIAASRTALAEKKWNRA